MYAAHVHNVRRDRSRGLGDVMTVLKNDRRANGRRQVVRFRVREPGDQLVVPNPGQAVGQQDRVGQPLDECAGHGVVGQHVGNGSRVGQVTGEQPLGEGDHRRRDRVDHGQAERVGQVRNAVEAKRLDDEQVVPVAYPGSYQVGQLLVAVDRVAVESDYIRHDTD